MSREAGERIGAAIGEALRMLAPQAALIVDCAGIQSATASALYAAWESAGVNSCPDRYLMLRIPREQRELCEAVAHLAQEWGVVVPTTDEANNWRVLGKLTIAEAQTLDTVRSQTSEEFITAALLAERLDIRISAASNRLKHLFDRRLIRREERLRPGGGREFVYTSLTPYVIDLQNEGKAD